MYRVGICDDDKILCASLEEQLYALAGELPEKLDVEVWYGGESLEEKCQLKNACSSTGIMLYSF